MHHAPSETLFLYIPPSCRHRAQQTRAAWVAAVAAAPGKQVPDYALSPRLIDGLDALAGLIAPVEPTRVAEAPEVEAPVAEAPSARPSGLLAALLDEDDEAPASAAPDEWAISAEAWQLAEPPDEPARHEPTHVVHSDAVIGDVEAGPRFEAELAVDGVSYVTLDGGRGIVWIR